MGEVGVVAGDAGVLNSGAPPGVVDGVDGHPGDGAPVSGPVAVEFGAGAELVGFLSCHQ